jgi:hypothetical protein
MNGDSRPSSSLEEHKGQLAIYGKDIMDNGKTTTKFLLESCTIPELIVCCQKMPEV